MAYRNYSYFVGVDTLGRVAVRSDKEFAYTDQFHQISDVKDDEWETQTDIRGIDFSAYANKNLADASVSPALLETILSAISIAMKLTIDVVGNSTVSPHTPPETLKRIRQLLALHLISYCTSLVSIYLSLLGSPDSFRSSS